MLILDNGDIELRIAPERGGGVASFRWRGRDIFHTRPGAPGPLALGCFPLSPFSGRIAQGRFSAQGQKVTLKRNHPSDRNHPHTLHGFDWLASFDVIEISATRAVLKRQYEKADWPWPYETEQVFTLTNEGYTHDLAVTNRGETPMAAGLGLHPFFPRDGARLSLHADGVWETTADRIPARWRALDRAPDWLGAGAIDHCFSGRRGAIVLDWPSHRLMIEPDAAFAFTVAFTPPGEAYFCVEPVSHMPDAVNRPEPPGTTGLRWLEHGERWATRTVFRVGEAAP